MSFKHFQLVTLSSSRQVLWTLLWNLSNFGHKETIMCLHWHVNYTACWLVDHPANLPANTHMTPIIFFKLYQKSPCTFYSTRVEQCYHNRIKNIRNVTLIHWSSRLKVSFSRHSSSTISSPFTRTKIVGKFIDGIFFAPPWYNKMGKRVMKASISLFMDQHEHEYKTTTLKSIHQYMPVI